MASTPKKQHIAILTCSEFDHDYLLYDDKHLLAEIKSNYPNIAVSFCEWENDNLHNDASLVVVRSPWNYVEKYAQFLPWFKNFAKQLSARKIKLCNDLDTIIWSSHKKYLTQLEQKGIAIVPSVLLPAHSSVESVFTVLKNKNWQQSVVKACVGAGGKNCIKVYASDHQNNNDDNDKFNELSQVLQFSDVLVQPYLNSIKLKGEVSVVFINEEISHAVIWQPVKKDFFLDYTVERSVYELSEKEKDLAIKTIQAAKQCVAEEFPSGSFNPKDKYLYARVDLLFDDQDHSKSMVSEVELFEPSLFFRYSKATTAKMAKAIAELLQ